MHKPDGLFGIFQVVKDFYEHGIDEHLWVFLLMVVIAADIILGLSRAWAYHEFSSSKFRKGLVSHTAMIVFVAIFYPFASFMNLGGVLDAFIMAMIAAYGSSVLASLSALGVEVPFIDRYVKENIDKEKFNLTSENEEKEKGENEND
jgi:toxin secretion/phage lysis holin